MSGINMRGTSPDPAVDAVYQGADKDPNITRPGNPDLEQVSTAELPGKSGSTTLGNIRPFYAEDKVKEIDQDASNDVDPPPTAGNSWEVGHDLYANGGGGRDYLLNNPEA